MLEIIVESQSDCPDWESAEYILRVIEESGMLPPKYSACIVTGEPKERGELDIFAWEKENE